MSNADAQVHDRTIGIITALTHETAALLAVFGNPPRHELPGTGGGRTYWEAEVQSERGGTHRVIITQAGMGNNFAAIKATQLLSAFSIQHIIMCGIAGGVPHHTKPAEHVRLNTSRQMAK